VQACYVIGRAMAFSLVFNGEGGDGDGTAGQGGGQAWLTAMPSGRRPAVLGRRQRGALGLAHGPVRRPCAALGRFSARVRDRHRMAETRRGSGSKATRARPPGGGTPYFFIFLNHLFPPEARPKARFHSEMREIPGCSGSTPVFAKGEQLTGLMSFRLSDSAPELR
jgi:hypothetical protein